ncbi:MAG: hypothetical protein K2P20_04270 [Oscillospiraceae bacterium]|nr:hypothetical protein [Oscillospiraceae bacterium]
MKREKKTSVHCILEPVSYLPAHVLTADFLSGKEETRRNPDGFQAFLTQPDEKFSVKVRAGAYWYSFLFLCGAAADHPSRFQPAINFQRSPEN